MYNIHTSTHIYAYPTEISKKKYNTPTLTLASKACRAGNTPWAKKKLERGQCAMAVPLFWGGLLLLGVCVLLGGWVWVGVRGKGGRLEPAAAACDSHGSTGPSVRPF